MKRDSLLSLKSVLTSVKYVLKFTTGIDDCHVNLIGLHCRVIYLKKM